MRREIPDVSSTLQTLSERVKGLALAVGFDLAGIARAEPTPESAFLREWLARGFAGEMHYLGRRAEERVDPRRVLEGVRSVVALGLVYDPGPGPASGAGALRVARYAGGEDYHDVLLDRVRALEAGLPALAGRSVRYANALSTSSWTLPAHASLLTGLYPAEHGVQIPASALLGFALDWGAFGVWIAFPLSFVGKVLLDWVAYRRGGWARVGTKV